jgi:hypothetical protein
LGALLGFLWARLGTYSIRGLRKVIGHLVPDPGRGPVTEGGIERVHLLAIGLDFLRGGLLTASGLLLGRGLDAAITPAWPLDGPATVALLALGAAIPAGALVKGLGGWKRRGVLFGAGVLGFLAGSLIL